MVGCSLGTFIHKENIGTVSEINFQYSSIDQSFSIYILVDFSGFFYPGVILHVAWSFLCAEVGKCCLTSVQAVGD